MLRWNRSQTTCIKMQRLSSLVFNKAMQMEVPVSPLLPHANTSSRSLPWEYFRKRHKLSHFIPWWFLNIVSYDPYNIYSLPSYLSYIFSLNKSKPLLRLAERHGTATISVNKFSSRIPLNHRAADLSHLLRF